MPLIDTALDVTTERGSPARFDGPIRRSWDWLRYPGRRETRRRWRKMSATSNAGRAPGTYSGRNVNRASRHSTGFWPGRSDWLLLACRASSMTVAHNQEGPDRPHIGNVLVKVSGKAVP